MRTRLVFGTVPVGGALICIGSMTPEAQAIGPDVVYTDCQSLSNHTATTGPVGGFHGYTLGSHTCNIGNQNLLWTSGGTPALGMNAYRLHGGRLVQIGQSWCKTACCAAAGNGCGLSCNGAGGSQLGAGCLDVYSSGWNANQGALAPRSGINPFSGAMAP